VQEITGDAVNMLLWGGSLLLLSGVVRMITPITSATHSVMPLLLLLLPLLLLLLLLLLLDMQ
jgi:hypothetical protein